MMVVILVLIWLYILDRLVDSLFLYDRFVKGFRESKARLGCSLECSRTDSFEVAACLTTVLLAVCFCNIDSLHLSKN